MNEWMNGVLCHDSALLRLYWAGDNLGEWFEFCYESCPRCTNICNICIITWIRFKMIYIIIKILSIITLHYISCINGIYNNMQIDWSFGKDVVFLNRNANKFREVRISKLISQLYVCTLGTQILLSSWENATWVINKTEWKGPSVNHPCLHIIWRDTWERFLYVRNYKL